MNSIKNWLQRNLSRRGFIFLAMLGLYHKLNGKDLLADHGFPLRLIIPRMYAYKGMKWVERIVLTEKREARYWEKGGYPVDGSIPGLGS